MAPVKFDDIPKTAGSVLNDDFQVSGYQFNVKQKTTFQAVEATTSVDINPADASKTPAKLTWKLPSPLGLTFFNVDKLEMDKAGKFKLEASSDKLQQGLKLEAKSDLADVSKVTVGGIYTGLKDTRMAVEMKATKPNDFTLDVTRSEGIATFGLKCTMANLTRPDIGIRLLMPNGIFGSLLAKEKFSTFTGHLCYKVNKDLQFAATYQHGGKQTGASAAGVSFVPKDGTTLKAKVQHDQSLSVSMKHIVSKGFTVLCGAKMDNKSKKHTVGFKLSLD